MSPPARKDVAPEDLRSHLFWRRTIQKNCVRLPPERFNSLKWNEESAHLPNLPMELLGMVERYLRLRDRISLRLTSRTLFIRLAAPMIQRRKNERRLARLRKRFYLAKLVRMERDGLTIIHRSGQGCYSEIAMRVCSFCIGCHHEHHFLARDLDMSPLTRRCLDAKPAVRCVGHRDMYLR
jgi:hypothetical protein